VILSFKYRAQKRMKSIKADKENNSYFYRLIKDDPGFASNVNYFSALILLVASE